MAKDEKYHQEYDAARTTGVWTDTPGGRDGRSEYERRKFWQGQMSAVSKTAPQPHRGEVRDEAGGAADSSGSSLSDWIVGIVILLLLLV